MALLRRVRLARTMRCARWDPGPGKRTTQFRRCSDRRDSAAVSATRASAESTGWQAVKTDVGRSSPNWIVHGSFEIRHCHLLGLKADSRVPHASAPSPLVAPQDINGTMFRGGIKPGAGITPARRQWATALSRRDQRSCAEFLAMPISRTIRARPAISRADSISITSFDARWVIG